MAIKPVDTRLDQMVSDTEQTQVKQMFDEVAQEQYPGEGVQVAGLVSGLRALGKAGKAVKQTQKATGKAVVDPIKRAGGEYIIPPTPAKKEVVESIDPRQGAIDQLEGRVEPTMDVSAPVLDKSAPPPPPPPLVTPDVTVAAETPAVRVEGDKIYARPATPEAMRKIAELVSVSQTSGKPPKVRPNLDVIDGEDSLKKMVHATAQYYSDWVSEQRRAGRTIDDIVNDAAEIGDVSALKLLAERKSGDRPFLDDETLASRIAVINLQAATMDAAKKAQASGNPQDMINALRMVTFEGYTQSALLGVNAEQGRALAINRLVVAPDRKRTMALQGIVEQSGIDQMASAQSVGDAADMIQQMGGMSQVKMAIDGYLNLPDNAARGVYSKSLLRAGLDSASEVYQSALVANPVTHAFNALGTPIHASMMMAERAVAAAMRADVDSIIGVSAGVRAIPRYFKQSMAAAWRAMETEMPSDAASKFDNSRIATKAENFGVAPDTMLGMTIDGLGVATRALGFRVLTTVDEGFKAMLRGMEMEMIAAEAQSRSFRAAIDGGVDEAAALDISARTYERTLQAESTFLEASEFARIATFQDELPSGILSDMQGFMQHPLTKLMGFPFYKTPAQVALRIQERTPLAVAMPRFWKAITNPSDPKERSIALAKLGVSSSIATSILATDYLSNDEVRFTGYGPTNPQQRRTWLQKHEPYSFGTKQPDGSYTWVSYARYDPLSGVLGMMADVRDTVMHTEDEVQSEKMLLDMSLAVMHYMGEAQPMVQFAAEFGNIIGPSYEGEDDKLVRITQLLQRQVVDSALVVHQSVATLGTAPQSATATYERYVDPFVKSTIPEDQYAYLDMPGWRMSLRGAYEGVQKARSRSSLFSDPKNLTRTNDWFEPVKRGFGDWTTFMPTRITEKRFNGVTEELLRINGGFKPLPRGLGESMIKLNDSQFERYKELVNYPNRGAYAPELMLGVKAENMTPEMQAELDAYPSLADHLLGVIFSPKEEALYQNIHDKETGEIRPASKGEKMDTLNTERARYMQRAKEMMLMEYPELKDLIKQRDKFKDKYGQPPQNLPLTPEVLSNLN
jgi:hypothetical protein